MTNRKISPVCRVYLSDAPMVATGADRIRLTGHGSARPPREAIDLARYLALGALIATDQGSPLPGWRDRWPAAREAIEAARTALWAGIHDPYTPRPSRRIADRLLRETIGQGVSLADVGQAIGYTEIEIETIGVSPIVYRAETRSDGSGDARPMMTGLRLVWQVCDLYEVAGYRVAGHAWPADLVQGMSPSMMDGYTLAPRRVREAPTTPSRTLNLAPLHTFLKPVGRIPAPSKPQPEAPKPTMGKGFYRSAQAAKAWASLKG